MCVCKSQKTFFEVAHDVEVFDVIFEHKFFQPWFAGHRKARPRVTKSVARTCRLSDSGCVCTRRSACANRLLPAPRAIACSVLLRVQHSTQGLSLGRVRVQTLGGFLCFADSRNVCRRSSASPLQSRLLLISKGIELPRRVRGVGL